MRNFGRLLQLAPVISGLLALAAVQPALAAGTDPGGTRAGTSVFNQAQVQYRVGGVDQTPVLSDNDADPNNGIGATEFVVDRKLDVLVAERSTAYNSATTLSVSPGQTGAVLAWTVTNEGNQTQDFLLSASATGFDPFGGTDNFDATGLTVFVDADGNNLYDPAVDTATHVDELDINSSVTVFLVANIPLAQVDGDIAAYVLEAQVAEGGGAGVAGGAIATDDRGIADTTLGVEDVFADGENANYAGDADRDGKHSSEDAYRIAAAVLSVLKSSAVISDPFTCPGGVCPVGSFPKAIPGAIVEYVVTITNAAGGAVATNVVIADDLSSEMGGPTPSLAFVADQYGAAGDIRLVYTPGAGAPVTSDLSEEADADTGQFIANVMTVNGVTLNAGDRADVSFRVEIQ
ncbi:MAG: hypothetical protein KJO54_05115 [Gammaproteobacteria bacterium]|nr:hypothetical protein [Gammaproteobacteria bacterium]NNF59854.1 hypothetical protein [Gammaproteobacteria bacterium]NNM21272.1 hypothetical protein [Gammaproteobacteria bacterium]